MHQNSVDYIAHFITFLKHEKRFSANTVIAYEGDVQEFRIFLLGLFGELDIKEIKYQHIRTWLAS
ncbi:MAG TPA: site-specific integrase, partial [Niabella sp.]|nr:site-specific integrase [Niabella sp.]